MAVASAQARECDKPCLEPVADDYRTGYVAHDPTKVPIAARVRFTENNVEMKFPDASWDTVTEEVGPALTLADEATQNVGIFSQAQRQRSADAVWRYRHIRAR